MTAHDSPLISDDAMVTRHPGMIDTMIGDELIGLDLESGNCYGFNATATRIWALAASPIRFGALCDQLVCEYEVDADQCRRDTSVLLSMLGKDGLITVTPTR